MRFTCPISVLTYTAFARCLAQPASKPACTIANREYAELVHHEFVNHYKACKAAAAGNLSACILVPGYLLPVLKALLAVMHLLKRFSKGTIMFDAPAANGIVDLCLIYIGLYTYTQIVCNQ